MLALALIIFATLDPAAVAARFFAEVDRRLDLAPGQLTLYRQLLADSTGALTEPQYLAVVDRSPHVQAFLLFFHAAPGDDEFIGATQVSTGRPGAFEYFATPLGLFLHTPANPDFRAEGTRNQNGIRGYGAKGMRVFDLGWVKATKGWGDHRLSVMRLQLHATDPDLLEPRLGTPLSKGCIRIPASLNLFLDRYAILDADYLAAQPLPFVLRPDRQPVSWPGRYVLILDTGLKVYD